MKARTCTGNLVFLSCTSLEFDGLSAEVGEGNVVVFGSDSLRLKNDRCREKGGSAVMTAFCAVQGT